VKSIKELIQELTELQAVGVEYIEFVDTNGNNYYFECLEQSGAKDFGYLVFDSEYNE
jgi:hypothetical protein